MKVFIVHTIIIFGLGAYHVLTAKSIVEVYDIFEMFLFGFQLLVVFGAVRVFALKEYRNIKSVQAFIFVCSFFYIIIFSYIIILYIIWLIINNS